MSYMERIEPMLAELAPDQLAFLSWQATWVGTARPAQLQGPDLGKRKRSVRSSQ